MFRRQRSLEVGQQYREAQRGPFGAPSRRVWVVEAVYEGRDGMLYGQLRDPSDDTVKTISRSALLDPSLYTPVG